MCKPSPRPCDSASLRRATTVPLHALNCYSEFLPTKGYVGTARTPHDGSVSVRFPAMSTTKARIKVEAVGNYFPSVNARPFAIT
jgi:hypothetical protein